MRVIDPGHKYSLNCLDEIDNLKFQLTFVKREGGKFPGNVGHYPGVNIQEILRALIDRITYVNNQEYDSRNLEILEKFRYSLYLLEQRAAQKHNRKLENIDISQIELYPSCIYCGHIKCKQTCREKHD